MNRLVKAGNLSQNRFVSGYESVVLKLEIDQRTTYLSTGLYSVDKQYMGSRICGKLSQAPPAKHQCHGSIAFLLEYCNDCPECWDWEVSHGGRAGEVGIHYSIQCW